MSKKEKKPIIQVFQLNDEKAEFEELKLEEGVELYEILNSKLILFFISPEIYRSYIWVGSESSTRMTGSSIRKNAYSIGMKVRDRIGRDIVLYSVDQNDEPQMFKFMVGLEKRPPNFIKKQLIPLLITIKVFQLNDKIAEFEELELEEGVPLYEILNSKLILYFVSPEIYRSFIWVGSEVSSEMIYIGKHKAEPIRERLGIAMMLRTLHQNDESLLFKIMIGLEKGSIYKALAKSKWKA
jgi:hypothetical protein